jgi:peptide methionine sulfoxide reductase msrA/msrB
MGYSKLILTIVFSYLSFISCSANNPEEQQGEEVVIENYKGKKETATFAGGCFWCIEAPFEGIDGVLSVVSGYAGGKEKNPTYSQVSGGKTSHKEAVQVVFDPDIISYAEIIDIFWQQFDPTDAGGSFFDRGTQYESAVFFHDNRQKAIAEAAKQRLESSGIFDSPVVTPIIKFTNFYPAEDYHQDYYKKSPREYKSYRTGSGRDRFISQYWEVPNPEKYKSPSKSELKSRLTNLQYQVTMEEATERAFDNLYNENKEAGIYVCIVSGAPLFSSKDKYESYSGWPSFTKPIDARFLEKPVDRSLGMLRVEVRSKLGDSHLGHVFNDGPDPTGLRYCMNSAAMKFIPKAQMESQGYANYLWLVE